MSEFDNRCSKTTPRDVQAGDSFSKIAKENEAAIKECHGIDPNKPLSLSELNELLKGSNPQIRDIHRINPKAGDRGDTIQIPDPNSKNCSSMAFGEGKELKYEFCNLDLPEREQIHYLTIDGQAGKIEPGELAYALALREGMEVELNTASGQSLPGKINLQMIKDRSNDLHAVGVLSVGDKKVRLPAKKLMQLVSDQDVSLSAMPYFGKNRAGTDSLPMEALAMGFNVADPDGDQIHVAVSPDHVLEAKQLVESGELSISQGWGGLQSEAGRDVVKRITTAEFTNPLNAEQQITLMPQAAIRYRAALLEISADAKLAAAYIHISDYRTISRQCELREQAKTDSSLTAAEPGNSPHNYGQAIDFSLATQNAHTYSQIDKILIQHGFVEEYNNGGHRRYDPQADPGYLNYQSTISEPQTAGDKIDVASLGSREEKTFDIKNDFARCRAAELERLDEEL